MRECGSILILFRSVHCSCVRVEAYYMLKSRVELSARKDSAVYCSHTQVRNREWEIASDSEILIEIHSRTQ